MGVKAVYGILILAFISSLLYAIGLTLPMHRMHFFAGWVYLLAKMETHVTYIDFPVGNYSFCKQMYGGAVEGSKDQTAAQTAVTAAQTSSRSWCNTLAGTHEIQNVAMNMCAPAIKFIWPAFCDGLLQAYTFGIVLIVVAVTNFLMQMIGCYFLYDYITRKANPQYRTIGIGMIAGGGGSMLIAVVLYGTQVIQNLDSIGGQGWTAAVLTTSKNFGFGPGFVLLGLGVALQLCQMCWTPYIEKEYEEATYLEDKQRREDRRDDERYGTFQGSKAGGAAPFGGGAPQSNFGIGAGGGMQMQPGGMRPQGAVMMQQAPSPMMSMQQPLMRAGGQPQMVMAGQMGGMGPSMAGQMGGMGPPMSSGFSNVQQTNIVTTSVGGPVASYVAGPSAPTELSGGHRSAGGGGASAAF